MQSWRQKREVNYIKRQIIIYVADVFLLRRLSSIPASSLFTLGPQTAFMRRMLIENFVLTELMSMKVIHPYFWRSKRGADVEFLVQNGEIIFPVEVKSGENTRSKSLAEFRKNIFRKYLSEQVW